MAAMNGFSALVAGIHAAALAPETWPDVLAALGRAIDTEVMHLSFGDPTSHATAFAATTGSDPAILKRFEERYLSAPKTIEAYRALAMMPVGVPVLREALMDDAAFVREPLYDEIMRPQGLHHVTRMCVEMGPEGFAILTANRRRRAGQYGEDELALQQLLQPHLRIAIATHRRLGVLHRRASALAEVLDQLDAGVLLLDATGRVVVANRRAEEILATRDGLVLAGGRLVAALAGENAFLARHVGRATATGAGRDHAPGGVLAISRPSGRRPVSLLITPMAERVTPIGGDYPTAIVFLADPDTADVMPSDTLMRLYGLTPREAQLALAMLDGSGLERAAERLGVTLGTAKTHLARVFDKTSTSRQGELIGLLLRAHAGVRNKSRSRPA